MMPTKLLLAHDHLLIRKSLTQLLTLDSSLEVVAEAASEEALHSMLAWQKVDVVLLGLSVSGVNSSDVVRKLTEAYPAVAVLVLSMHDEPQLALNLLNSGAQGFISSNQPPETLFSAIHQVARQQRYLPSRMAEEIIFSTQKNNKNSLHYYQLLSLRERQVMHLLSEGKNINAIATHLNISNKTVSTHKVRMMAKMKFTSNADIVKFVIKYEH